MPRVASDEITIMDITDGDPAPRLASRRLFRALTSVPQTPAATITWATNALSSIETGWSETAPTQQAASATSVYFSDLLFSDTTGTATSTTATGTSPLTVTSFSGLVTFSSGDFSKDGSAITDIDGGNIATGTIAATQINADAITGKNITVGTLTDTAIPTGTKEGVRIASDGTMVVGDIDNYLRWDGSQLIVQGQIINLDPNIVTGLSGAWTAKTSNTPISDDWATAGVYRVVIVGAGGGAGATKRDLGDPSTLHFGSGGGGAGGCAWGTITWDGSTAIEASVGVGGEGSTAYSNQRNASSGTPTYINVGSTGITNAHMVANQGNGASNSAITAGTGGNSTVSTTNMPSGNILWETEAGLIGGSGGSGSANTTYSTIGGGGGVRIFYPNHPVLSGVSNSDVTTALTGHSSATAGADGGGGIANDANINGGASYFGSIPVDSMVGNVSGNNASNANNGFSGAGTNGGAFSGGGGARSHAHDAGTYGAYGGSGNRGGGGAGAKSGNNGNSVPLAAAGFGGGGIIYWARF
jgi:hypothetical protein